MKVETENQVHWTGRIESYEIHLYSHTGMRSRQIKSGHIGSPYEWKCI